MAETKVKRHSLRPIVYDEVSLVDEGAAGSAQVLIFKRAGIRKLERESRVDIGGTGDTATSRKKNRKKRRGKLPGRTSASNLDSSTSKPDSSTSKPKKSSGRSQSNPCSDETNSSGTGKGKRSKTYKEERHPRDEQGQFDETSQSSKEKYGKGGTTKSKLDRACRDKKKKRKSGPALNSSEWRDRGRKPVQKRKMSVELNNSNLGSWDSKTRLLEIMERKSR